MAGAPASASIDASVDCFSGGSTGAPKGILLSDKNFNALALQCAVAIDFDFFRDLRFLAAMPVFHGFGLGVGIHTALIGGATCILIPQFSVKVYADTLLKQKPELIPGVPTLFEALLRAEQLENADLSFLKGIFSGGDSLSPELKKKVDTFLHDHGCTEQIREGYGTTECVTASCLTPKAYAREGSIGVPYPDTFYKIVQVGTTDEVKALTEGEICISGPTVMLGDMDNPEETAQTLQQHADGKLWLHTGDLGTVDEEGFVRVTGRMTRMILISANAKIYPAAIEAEIASVPGVQEVVFCAVPKDDGFYTPVCYIVPESMEDAEKVKAAVEQFCAAKFPEASRPKRVFIKEQLPLNKGNKPDILALEKEAAEAMEKEA